MGNRKIKLISRPVEVNRQKINGIECVLLSVSLRLNQKHFLGQSVGSISLFGVSIPEIVLGERNRGVLWITTDRPDRDKFLDMMKIGFVHELDAHDRVVVEEAAWVIPIGADSSDDGSEMNDNVRLMVVEHMADTTEIA